MNQQAEVAMGWRDSPRTVDRQGRRILKWTLRIGKRMVRCLQASWSDDVVGYWWMIVAGGRTRQRALGDDDDV